MRLSKLSAHPSRGSTENTIECGIREAHEQRRSHDDRRRAEVSGRSEKNLEQGGLGRAVLGQVVPDHARSFRGDYDFGSSRQLESLFAAQLGLCIDGLPHRDRVSRKVPLRFAARRSALSVIEPVRGLGHETILLAFQSKSRGFLGFESGSDAAFRRASSNFL